MKLDPKALGTQLLDDFRPERLLPALTASFVNGVLMITFSVSFGLLIFSGDLSPFIPNGIGLVLLAALIANLLISLTSSFGGIQACPQDIPAAISAMIAVSISAQLKGHLPLENIFQTVVASIALTSILSGVFLFTLGRFKLGGLIRFIPYPVIGGFMAGIGWLMSKGAVNVMTGLSLNASNLTSLLNSDMLIRWCPGLLFALVLLLVLRHYTFFMITPALLLSFLALFYVVLFASGMSVSVAQAQGFLLQPFEQGDLWRPLTLSAVVNLPFSALSAEIVNIVTILVLSAVSLLLYISGLELTVKKDIDVNHELQSAGVTNFIAGLFSTGPVGFHSPSLSVLSHRMAPGSRLTGVIGSLILGVALFFGSSFIGFLPKFLLGGFILYLGLSFLVEWVYDGWFKLSRTDYYLVIFILVSIGIFGFIEGVGIGIVVAIVLFVIKYSSIDVIKHVLDGDVYHSNVDRSPSNHEILNDKAKQLYILKLQGFIFFGTANSFLAQIKTRLEETTLPAVGFIVLDFTLVNGLDSSALNSFEKLKQLAEMHGFSIVFTSVKAATRRKIELHYGIDETIPVRFFQDLDHGVEWCEEQILVKAHAAGEGRKHSLQTFLMEEFDNSSKVKKILPYFEKRTLKQGAYLVKQGDKAKHIYYIETGSVAIELELPGGKTIRLRKMQSGTIVGEVGVYLNETRTASIVANKNSIVYHLSGEALEKMKEKDPELAALFHQIIVKILANRLKKSNNMIEALID